MGCDPSSDPINSYALVSYIPGRLGDFITNLRQDLVAACVARSHVSILPPRPLQGPPDVAAEQIRNLLLPFAPFEIDMPKIGVFEQTAVIFCEIGSGRDQLVELHEVMNAGALTYEEPFEYHPHVTLAQGFDPELLPGLYEMAYRRWEESAPSSRVLIENVTFVQNTANNVWIDLDECELRGLAALPVG